MPNTWIMVANTLNGQERIHSLAEFNGRIYGGTGTGGRLFEWRTNTWVEVSASLGGANDIHCLIVYENNLYGGTDNGQLQRWTGAAWVLIHDIGTPGIMAFVIFQGNLYFSTSENSGIGGRLYRWTGLGGPAPAVVAAQLNGQIDVHSLISYEGEIYGGTGLGGRLFRWDRVSAWTQVAAQYGATGQIRDLLEYEGRLFAAGSDTGLLLEWTGTAWTLRAGQLLAQNNIFDLIIHHENKILGGTETLANLFMWNGVDAWLQVAPQPAAQIGIHPLIEFEDRVYGGSFKDAATGGRLYRWSSQYPAPPTGLLVCDLASSIGPDGECVPAIIDTIAPYFSAIFNHPHQHAVGKHFRIQVNTQYDLAGTVMWDSGKTPMADVAEGERCENLWYGGSALSIDTTYYWRIMFYDEDGFLGDWSAVNCFRVEEVVVPDVKPPKYRLVIGDPDAPSHILACEADKQDVFEMHFTLRQNGGCAEFSLKLKDTTFTINLGDAVSIYLFGGTSPWYTGRVLEMDGAGSSSTVRNYSGYGYFDTLNGHSLVNRNFGVVPGNEQTIIAIVTYIMTNCVGTRFLSSDYSQVLNPAVVYNVQNLQFDLVKPVDALTELAELATNYEFGVNERRRLYFRPISTAITERKWVGKHIASYSPKENIRKVVNNWYLEGGVLVAGSNYDAVTGPVSNAPSILSWGQRADKATIPDGFDVVEIARWGADLLAKTQDPILTATITGINIEETRTRIWPRGQMRITSEDGTSVLDYPMKAVTYHITPAGITADVELGEKKPSSRDPIRALQKQLYEEREQLAHDVAQLASGTAVTAIWDADFDTGVDVTEVGGTDQIAFDIAGVEVLLALAGSWVFNETGINVIFRWEGGGDANLLYLDPVNDRVGIGTNVPTYKLDVVGNAGIDEYLYHNGNPNTYLRFQADDINLATAGSVALDIDSSGRITLPLQPTFLVRADGTQTNIVADGAVTIAWQTEIFDIGGNFATPSFTAPVTGRYLLSASLYINDVDSAATRLAMEIVTTSRSYQQLVLPDSMAGDDPLSIIITVVADMNAAETAHVTIRQTGGANQADIHANSYFSGALLS